MTINTTCDVNSTARDESYPHLQSKTGRDKVNQITNIRATMSSKRSAVKLCVKGTKWSHVASLLEMEH